MFYKIDILKNFAKFTGRRLCRSLFLVNLQGSIHPKTLMKEKTPMQMFPDEFSKILKTPFLQNISNYSVSEDVLIICFAVVLIYYI